MVGTTRNQLRRFVAAVRVGVSVRRETVRHYLKVAGLECAS